MKLVDNDWKLAGKTGWVLVVTGSNSTVEDARRQAYRRIDNIMFRICFIAPISARNGSRKAMSFIRGEFYSYRSRGGEYVFFFNVNRVCISGGLFTFVQKHRKINAHNTPIIIGVFFDIKAR